MKSTMTAEDIMKTESQYIAQTMKKDSGEFKRNIKEEFNATFLEACDPYEEIKNINGIKNIKGQRFGWNTRLAEGKEDIFNDIGFSWAGHQRFAGWDCRYNSENEKDFNRKTIYYMDIVMAKTMAVKYVANSIVLTERGFSLRWGCVPQRTNSHKGKYFDAPEKPIKSKLLCGATGMGVWIVNHINLSEMKKHAENGATISEALIKHVENYCGMTEEEGEKFMAGYKVNKHAGDVLWIKGGIHPNKYSVEYKKWLAKAKRDLKIHKIGDANIVRQAKKDVKKMKAEEKAEEEAELRANAAEARKAERTLDVGAPKKKIIMIKKKKKFVVNK